MCIAYLEILIKAEKWKKLLSQVLYIYMFIIHCPLGICICNPVASTYPGLDYNHNKENLKNITDP